MNSSEPYRHLKYVKGLRLKSWLYEMPEVGTKSLRTSLTQLHEIKHNVPGSEKDNGSQNKYQKSIEIRPVIQYEKEAK